MCNLHKVEIFRSKMCLELKQSYLSVTESTPEETWGFKQIGS